MNVPLLLLLALWMLPFSNWAQKALVHDEQNVAPIGRHLVYYEDFTKQMGWEQLKSLPEEVFYNNGISTPNFGVRNTKLWLKLTLKNQTSASLFLLCDEENIYIGISGDATLLALMYLGFSSLFAAA